MRDINRILMFRGSLNDHIEAEYIYISDQTDIEKLQKQSNNNPKTEEVNNKKLTNLFGKASANPVFYSDSDKLDRLKALCEKKKCETLLKFLNSGDDNDLQKVDIRDYIKISECSGLITERDIEEIKKHMGGNWKEIEKDESKAQLSRIGAWFTKLKTKVQLSRIGVWFTKLTTKEKIAVQNKLSRIGAWFTKLKAEEKSAVQNKMPSSIYQKLENELFFDFSQYSPLKVVNSNPWVINKHVLNYELKDYNPYNLESKSIFFRSEFYKTSIGGKNNLDMKFKNDLNNFRSNFFEKTSYLNEFTPGEINTLNDILVPAEDKGKVQLDRLTKDGINQKIITYIEEKHNTLIKEECDASVKNMITANKEVALRKGRIGNIYATDNEAKLVNRLADKIKKLEDEKIIMKSDIYRLLNYNCADAAQVILGSIDKRFMSTDRLALFIWLPNKLNFLNTSLPGRVQSYNNFLKKYVNNTKYGESHKGKFKRLKNAALGGMVLSGIIGALAIGYLATGGSAMLALPTMLLSLAIVILCYKGYEGFNNLLLATELSIGNHKMYRPSIEAIHTGCATKPSEQTTEKQLKPPINQH